MSLYAQVVLPDLVEVAVVSLCLVITDLWASGYKVLVTDVKSIHHVML